MNSRDIEADVVVVGLGPAGRALTHRATAAGLDVTAVDPHPYRVWTPTYAAWEDELPRWLPTSVVAGRASKPGVWTTQDRPVDRSYVVLDTAALQQSLTVDDAHVLADSATELGRTTVQLSSGRTILARRVVDARGTPAGMGLAEQTAYGVVVPTEIGRQLLDGHDAWIMDWRQDNGASPHEIPSFLYVVPLDEHRVLLEETCLAGIPAVTISVLKLRLEARLAGRGIELSGSEAVERVRFSVQAPRRVRNDATSRPTLFGARAGMMHPATGYSVAASLAMADVTAEQLAGDYDTSRMFGATRAVQALRNLGLRTALRLPPEQIPRFFDSFFALPVDLQRSYLSGARDVSGTMTAMLRMFPTLPVPTRIALARAVLDPRTPA